MKTSRVITLPSGRSVTLGEFVRSWRLLQTLPAGRDIDRGWNWYPESAGEILRQISRGVHDRINRHLPWYAKIVTTSRFEFSRNERQLERAFARGFIRQECRWCGSPMAHRALHHARFCDPSCQRSYHS